MTKKEKVLERISNICLPWMIDFSWDTMDQVARKMNENNEFEIKEGFKIICEELFDD